MAASHGISSDTVNDVSDEQLRWAASSMRTSCQSPAANWSLKVTPLSQTYSTSVSTMNSEVLDSPKVRSNSSRCSILSKNHWLWVPQKHEIRGVGSHSFLYWTLFICFSYNQEPLTPGNLLPSAFSLSKRSCLTLKCIFPSFLLSSQKWIFSQWVQNHRLDPNWKKVNARRIFG